MVRRASRPVAARPYPACRSSILFCSTSFPPPLRTRQTLQMAAFPPPTASPCGGTLFRAYRAPAPARRRALAPARFARLIAHVRASAQAQGARLSFVSMGFFRAGAGAKASGLRMPRPPANLGAVRSDVKPNYEFFQLPVNIVHAMRQKALSLRERIERGRDSPQRARSPGSFKRNGPRLRLVPRDENGPFLIRQSGLAADLREKRPQTDAAFGPDGLLETPVSFVWQVSDCRIGHVQPPFTPPSRQEIRESARHCSAGPSERFGEGRAKGLLQAAAGAMVSP